MSPETATLPDQFNVDERLSVGEAGPSTEERYQRALDAENHQLLDALTNQRTKWTRTEEPSPARTDVPRNQVSLADDPGAMFTRPFSEVKEMAQLWGEAVSSVQARRGAANYSPAQMQDNVNDKMRELMSEGTSPAARQVQTALDRNGYDPRTLRIRRWVVGGVVNFLTEGRDGGIVVRSGALIRAGGIGVLMIVLGVSLVVGAARVLTGSEGGGSVAAVVRRAGRVFVGIRLIGAGCVAVVVLASAVMAASEGASAGVSGWAGHVGAVLMVSAFAEALVRVYRPLVFRLGEMDVAGGTPLR